MHKLKFPLASAFLMIHMLSSHRKGISTCELARQFGVKQSTAWFFKRKVQQAMNSTSEHLLSGIVEVDETVVGGKEKGGARQKSWQEKNCSNRNRNGCK
ncbi:MAG: IS1595 family transposase [Crocinitomicaceae bacterium]|nr:IS1595 family transposase [Crocinitomicaceae bacterium]